MRTVLISLLSLIYNLTAVSQDMTHKVVLQKGEIIRVSSDMNSSNTQSMMGGDPMETKTTLHSSTELVVSEVLEDGYLISQTLKSMKMDFDGFGQKMSYDSESKEKQDNPFVKQIADKINVPENIKLSFAGVVIEEADDHSKEGKKGEHKKGDGPKGGGRGMMKMMNGGGASILENAFLIIPKDASEKGGWETKTEKDGLTTRKKYTLGAVMGNMATVTVQSQTKGEIEMNRGGMAMTSKVNTTAEEMYMVNTATGKVQMFTAQLNNNSKTIISDKESPSTGKTSITTTYE